jgi:hypothetical protein
MLKVEMPKAFTENNQDNGYNNQVISDLWALYMQNSYPKITCLIAWLQG